MDVLEQLGSLASSEGVLDTNGDLLSVIEEGVGHDGRVDGEEPEVDNNVTSSHVSGRVGLVRGLVEDTSVVGDGENVVSGTVSVERLVRVDREVTSVPGVGVVDTDDHEPGQEHAEGRVNDGEGGHDQRIGVQHQGVPIERGDRVVTQTVDGTDNVVEDLVVGGDPTHPVEHRERGEDVGWEPEVEEHGGEGEDEALHSGCSEGEAEWTLDWEAVVAVVQCRVEGNGNEGRGPNRVDGVDEETSGNTSHTVTDKVDGQREEDLVGELGGVRLVEVLRQVLGEDDVTGVRGGETDGGHDGDHHVLLLVEWTWVERVSRAEESEAFVWENPLAEFTDRVGEQLRDVGTDGDRRLSDGEQLVDESTGDDKKDSDHPCSDGRRGQCRVVFVVNHSSNFGVWRVILDQGRLDEHLVNQRGVLLRVGHDVWVVEELLGMLNGTDGEVGVVLVDSDSVLEDLVDPLEGECLSVLFGLSQILSGELEVAEWS